MSENVATPPQLLYHRSNALYVPGDRILPGNWGRIVLGIGATHPHFFREYLWERLRQSEFPKLPSRMAAAFAFQEFARAESFVQNAGWPTYTYIVTMADVALPKHRADIGWWDIVAGYHAFHSAEGCARHYWKGDEQSASGWEWLTAGELIVTQRLTPVPSNGAA